MPDLNDWKRGDPLTAAHLQEPIGSIRALLAATNGALGSNPQVSPDNIAAVMFGKIVDAGPNGESDLSGTLVWCQVQYLDGADTIDSFATFKDDWDTEDPVKRIIPATNLGDTDGSHNTPVDTKCVVFAVWDSQETPIIRYLALPASQPAAPSPVAVLHLTDVWPGSGLYQAVAGPGTGAVVYASIDTITTSTDVTESMFTGGSGSNNIAIHLREINGTGHKLTPGTGTNTICVLAIRHDVDSLDGKGIYFFGFTGQTKPGCPVP
jgi:hypothetical protein